MQQRVTYVGPVKLPSDSPCITESLAELLENPQSIETKWDCMVQPTVASSSAHDCRTNQNTPRRLHKLGHTLSASYVFFDLDLKHLYPDRERNEQGGLPWSSLTPAEQEQAESPLTRFVTGFGNTVTYRTRHGLRAILALPSPIPIGITGSAYEHLTNSLLALATEQGLTLDDSVTDWTHLFRLPFADVTVNYFPAEASPLLLSLMNRALTQHPPERELAEHAKQGFPALPTMADVAIPAIIDPPSDLEQARTALPRWMQDALPTLERYDEHRNVRLLKGSESVAKALAMTPYFTFGHCYHLLAPAATTFGYDQSERVPYLAQLPRFVATAMARAEAHRRAMATMDAAALPPRPTEPDANTGEAASPAVARGGILYEAVRTYLPDVPPLDDIGVLVWMGEHRRLMLATNQGGNTMFMPLARDGFYYPFPQPITTLGHVIREYSYPRLIATDWEIDEKVKPKTPKQLVDEYCTLVNGQKVVYGPRGCSLQFENGFPMLGHSPIIPIDHEPKFDADIDQWLTAMFAERKDEFLRAFIPIGRPQDGPTAIVAIIGARKSGKNMLVHGISEWFSPSKLAHPNAITSEYEDDLYDCAIIHAEEGFGSGGKDLAEKLRRFTGGARKRINPKGKGKVEVAGIHRMVVTANNMDWMQLMIGDRSLTQDDKEAIASRIAIFHVRREASMLLESKKQHQHTNGWVAHEAAPTEYRLARHLVAEMHRLFTFKADGKLVRGEGRLLYDGESTPELDAALDTGVSDTEANAMIGINVMFSSNGVAFANCCVDMIHWGVWVTVSGVIEAMKRRQENTSPVWIGRTLNALATSKDRIFGATHRYFIPFSRLFTKGSLYAEWTGQIKEAFAAWFEAGKPESPPDTQPIEPAVRTKPAIDVAADLKAGARP
jgi:hypothetical protein